MAYCRMWFLSLPLLKNLHLRFRLLNPVFSQGLHRRYTWDFLGTLGCWSVRLHTQSKNSAAPFTTVTQISLHGGGQQWGVWEWHAPNSHLGIGSGCSIKSQESSSICTDPSSAAAPTEDWEKASAMAETCLVQRILLRAKQRLWMSWQNQPAVGIGTKQRQSSYAGSVSSITVREVTFTTDPALINHVAKQFYRGVIHPKLLMVLLKEMHFFFSSVWLKCCHRRKRAAAQSAILKEVLL